MKKFFAVILMLPLLALAKGRFQNSDFKSLFDLQTANGTITGNISSSTACIASPSSTVGLFAGQYVYDQTNLTHIPPSATIIAIPGSCSAGQIQMSANANNTATGDSISFGAPPTELLSAAKVWDATNGQQLSVSIATNAFAGTGGLTNVVGTVGSPQSVSAAGGVSVTSQTVHGPNLVFVAGNGGAVTVTATPSITACTAAGEYLTLVGASNTNPVTLQSESSLSGSKLVMNSNIVLGAGATANFACDATSGNWVRNSYEPSFITATGGTITTDGNFKIHTFTSGGTFTVTSGVTSSAEVLVVAGGGGGGSNSGGGGGAGGTIDNASVSLVPGAYSVTIGAGGAGGTANGNGLQGGNSIFQGLTTAVGGGYGEGDGASLGAGNGGSGGGTHYNNNLPGTGTVGQGFAGGFPGSHFTNCDSGLLSGAGGGGATSVGQGGCGTIPVSLQGGIGMTVSISGSAVCYAGGGNGGYQSGTAAASQCGSGVGSTASTTGGNATANSGGGGGGSGGNNIAGGNGGSGIVVIRYRFQ